ncbi:RraA family protein [Tuwongella immobilis]|uniref:Putative 4-hydroxy-4-methyl-2-oxoglutarate aldolase n=1 Tax=Tuwongella immobilis TaxID=692036 RepID=A0A6C2YJG1_9BACT|nr:RraA family protein [Tuwongella immobilis]VIP01504.1 demethylmenaquinone methyltransferase : Demethylmenaquinone methyltransferase OS=Planctomyces maris DSM 8797 GN=PM8797T_18766 PE=4 SV=1: Methyltransf_6 [Tuwongella immobilis]VTR98604.1 demethylmenaquinone methyltransferase : Demethylmenaquinone methyltransferase OS=Planctomyces maris DSM 8797 GN=PM8797T_18766 PE=4 SV=1: Methyltransf_6 [Tuwongella immobilis]
MPATTIPLDRLRQCLTSAVVCDALDALGYRNQSPRLALQPLSSDQVLIGRCKTTLWADMSHSDPKPYELELKAIDSCQSDEILIAAASGSNKSGIWGELLSTAARNRGCVGVIVDGMIRDLARIREMRFPCWALGTNIYDSKDRQRVIDVDVIVEIAGVRFCPGDLVVADLDGVVVVPQEIEATAIQSAWNKVHAENEVRDAIRAGMLATEAFAKFGVL